LDVPKIEGVVKKEDFKVERVSITDGYGRVGFYLAICYKGIPLWRTLDSNLDKYKFYLYDPREYAVEDPFVLVCVDGYGDLFTYGNWQTLKEALEWLEDPKPLY